jgi:hypothetical protein
MLDTVALLGMQYPDSGVLPWHYLDQLPIVMTQASFEQKSHSNVAEHLLDGRRTWSPRQ